MPGTQGLSAWLAQSVGFATEGSDCYEFDHATGILGAGSFGKVLMGRNKSTGSSCAIKQIAKSSAIQANTLPDRLLQAREEALKMEVKIMRMLDHRHIIRLFDNFEDHANHYVVMELCAGGRLSDFVGQSQDFRESDVAIVMRQLFSALEYIHRMHIVHRDIKPDNMLLESRGPIRQNTLKLIDFGLSCRCRPGQELRSSAGTPEFMSPQAVDGRCDGQADIWSCGVTMYTLLCGSVPFRAETESGVFAAIRRGNFTFPAADWRDISDDAKAFVRLLLKMNPHERCSAEDALGHAWVRQTSPTAAGDVQLQAAVARFRAKSAHRKRPQPEKDTFSDVRAAWAEVTQWANSLLPPAKSMEGPVTARSAKKLVWV